MISPGCSVGASERRPHDRPLLETKGVSKHYGEFRALDDVSVAVRDGEFVSVVGPNGAGKTTLVNLLTGLLVPTKGEVFFKGTNIAGVGPVVLAKRGMARDVPARTDFSAAHRGRDDRRRRRLPAAQAVAAVLAPCPAMHAVSARVAEIARIFGLERRLDSRLAPALAGREEAAGRGIRLRAEPRGDPARRADIGRLDGREARR